MNTLRESMKTFEPKLLALAIAENTVINHLKAMEGKTFQLKGYEEAYTKVKHTDYEAAMQRISADPAFKNMLNKLPNDPYDAKMISELCDNYVQSKAHANENSDNINNMRNHNVQTNTSEMHLSK